MCIRHDMRKISQIERRDMQKHDKNKMDAYDIVGSSLSCNLIIYSESLCYFSDILTKRLFVANEILQGCLLHVQSLCEAASNSRTGYGTEDSGILFVNLDKRMTYMLSDFVQVQRVAAETGAERLLALRKHIVLVVWESCAVCKTALTRQKLNIKS